MKYFLMLALLLMNVLPAWGALRTGDFAPKVKVTDLKGAQFVVPDSLRGKVSVILFWSVGCSSCLEEMPAMEALYREYQRKGLAIVAVNIGQTREIVREAISGRGLSYPILLDADNKMTESYDVAGVPRTVILDRNGIVRFKIIGSVPGSKLKKLFQSLM